MPPAIIKRYHELMGEYLDDVIPISDSVQYIAINVIMEYGSLAP